MFGKLAIFALFASSLAFGQGPLGFAALPVNWVDNTVCDPPGGTYDTEVLLGTTNNIGPNVAGEAIGAPYALTPAGLLDAMNNWRDNADNASQTPHFADRWWRIKVPAGTVLHETTYDANGAGISLPGKGTPSSEPTKCLVIESTTPLTAGQMACGRGLPGLGGARNPGCTSPNDKTSMWKVQMEGTVSLHRGIVAGTDLVTPTNIANHIVLRDVELGMLGGTAPSKAPSSQAIALFQAPQNPLGTRPPGPVANVIGLDRFYAHGNDPGDPGQPTTGSNVDAVGNCLGWYNSGMVNTANTDGTHGSVTLTSFTPTLAFGNAAFGPTFTVGSTINIGGTFAGAGSSITGGTNYTISAFDPTTSNTVLTVNGQPGTQTGVHYLQINPPSQYTPGCGDDVEKAVSFNVDNGWMQNGYIEKVHWWNAESEGATFGFDNGPEKIVNNWLEGASNALFSGGAPADQSGGPGSDNEIRRNYMGRDLNYRLLSAQASNSPKPPWGCGPFDGTASHNTCPFNWAVKNTLEMKVGHRNLVDGNIIENSWSDGQSGFVILVNLEAGSGGQAVGVFDPVTGLPATLIDNLRISNNWVRNTPQIIQQVNRGNMGPANGGGISLAVTNFDTINNLFSNITDTAQFGSPGHIWQFTSGGFNGNSWTCAMSYIGTGPYTITASCKPYQTDLKTPAHISNITVDASHNVTITHGTIRIDPTLCQSTTAACIAAGQTIVITGVSGLTAGSFAMTGTSGNWASDGTGGTTIVYNDGTSTAGTKCSSVSTCTTLIGTGDITFASLAGKLMDVSVGDDVYAYALGGADTTCTSGGYLSGATAANLAVIGTVPTGLTVKYQLAVQPSAPSATCLVSNGAGFPKNVTVQNNTFLAVGQFAFINFVRAFQPISNYFHDNVFAVTASSLTADIYASGTPTGEGTTAYLSWDPASSQFYHNVLQGRNSANWSVQNCPGGTCTNSFPSLVTCQGPAATTDCLGYVGFMNQVPFPTSPCSAANAPFNCPLMALPWANNLTLDALAYDPTSSYSTQGVSITQLKTAMLQTLYVCPVGASCGTHGPYSDGGSSPTPPPPPPTFIPPNTPASLFITVAKKGKP